MKCKDNSLARLFVCFCFAVAGSFCATAQQPSGTGRPEQVAVTVKIIEFQSGKGVETGLSAFFANLPRANPFGVVRPSGNAINAADLTFPASTGAGITVFLDRLRLSQGEIEIVLQALVDENRATILSETRTMAIIGEKTPSVVQTTQEIPYESTIVVGQTTQQITAFEATGVELHITVPEVIDDDGLWTTQDDTFIRLDVHAVVKEEGQRIVVALDDPQAAGSDISLATNALKVPEFISRSIKTHVWVRHGQVLMLGGLYRNSKSNNLITVPWLSQSEDIAIGLAERLIPGNFLASPLTALIGNRKSDETRRELVFLIKAEIWKPGFGMGDLGFEDLEIQRERRGPGEVLSDIVDNFKKNVVKRVQSEESEEEIESDLGGLEP